MMKIKKYHFNLIEIVLTVAVVAFGVVIILGMLPKGLQATRSSSTVTYSSSVIDQLAGHLQTYGSQGVTSTGFDDGVVDDEAVTGNYLALISHVDDNNFNNSDFVWFSRGVFKYKGADDVYVVVMGSEQEFEGGEKESNVDFSGMIRVCKQTGSDRKGTFAAVTHDGVTSGSTPPDGHECFDSDGNLKCGANHTKFHAEEKEIKGATVYMELSFPLSLPYAERKKVYYSFDVKE